MIPLRLKAEAGVVVLLLSFGVTMCHARDATIREKAVLTARIADADRDLDVWLKHAAHTALHVDTLVDTVRVTIAGKPAPPSVVTVQQLVLDTAWARRWVDSVRKYVVATKNADEQCLTLASECALFRVETQTTNEKYERQIALLEQMPRGCSLRERLTWAAIGSAPGAIAGAYVRSRP
jgi:hypothetical protein